MDILKGGALVRSPIDERGPSVFSGVRGLPPPPPGDITGECVISTAGVLLLPGSSWKAELFPFAESFGRLDSRLRVHWVTLKVQACPRSQPPKCTLSVCPSGDPESVAGEYGRHSLYKDALLLQPGGPPATALAVGGLLPGHQGAREHRTEQVSCTLFPQAHTFAGP